MKKNIKLINNIFFYQIINTLVYKKNLNNYKLNYIFVNEFYYKILN